jgi:beta-lactamase regulating signal transducer with metallopeptidase domain
VWWAASLSKQDAELACDEATIRKIGEDSRSSYGRTLIELTCREKRKGSLVIAATTMSGSKKE